MRRYLPLLLVLLALHGVGCKDCERLLEAKDLACSVEPGGPACRASTLAASACPVTPPTTTPPATLPPVTPPPTTLPPPPSPAPGCVLALGPADQLEPVPGHVQQLGDLVNAVMAAITGCEVGSDCLLKGKTAQSWQAEVEAALRQHQVCAGQHAPDTDEIAVSRDPRDPGGDVWEAFHVAAGSPETRLTVVWSYGTQTEPVPGPPEHYVGANRPAYRVTPPPVVTPPVTPPASAACPYRPLPATRRINAKPHVGKQLDSTPQIGDAAYCAARGWTDGRLYCAVAQEGDPARTACEAELLGRPCPVWQLVSGAPGLRLEYSGEDADVAHCGTDSGFLVWVVGSGSGEARACNADGSLCSGAVAVTR